MIDYENKDNIKTQIGDNISSLEKYKDSYNKKIKMYNLYFDIIDNSEKVSVYRKEYSLNILKDKINSFNEQKYLIDKNLKVLNILKLYFQNYEIHNKSEIEKELINKYNNQYDRIKKIFINNCVFEDRINNKYIKFLTNNPITKYEVEKNARFENDTINKVENDISPEIGNNDTLLISEKEGKVVLPYTSKEILDLIENKKYQTIDEAIEKEFTRDFSDYKIQFTSRYKETMKLARKKEGYGILDSISLATEMMKKRFLHPAIISACRNLNELDVYIDCLEKNELDDFKIFKIKYELYPMKVKNNIEKNITSTEKLNETL